MLLLLCCGVVFRCVETEGERDYSGEKGGRGAETRPSGLCACFAAPWPGLWHEAPNICRFGWDGVECRYTPRAPVAHSAILHPLSLSHVGRHPSLLRATFCSCTCVFKFAFDFAGGKHASRLDAWPQRGQRILRRAHAGHVLDDPRHLAGEDGANLWGFLMYLSLSIVGFNRAGRQATSCVCMCMCMRVRERAGYTIPSPGSPLERGGSAGIVHSTPLH